MSDTKNISDGYHTFGELYEHRHALFLCLLKLNSYSDHEPPWFDAYWTRKHHPDNDPMFDLEGMPGILVGIELPATETEQERARGYVEYHLPARFIPVLENIGVRETPHASYYDGSNSPDACLTRMQEWIGLK